MTISRSPIIEWTTPVFSNITSKCTLLWILYIAVMSPNSIWPPTKDWIRFCTTSISIIEVSSNERIIWCFSLKMKKKILIVFPTFKNAKSKYLVFTILHINGNLVGPWGCWISRMLKITITTIAMNIYKVIAIIIMITFKKTFPDCRPIFNFVCPEIVE